MTTNKNKGQMSFSLDVEIQNVLVSFLWNLFKNYSEVFLQNISRLECGWLSKIIKQIFNLHLLRWNRIRMHPL